MMRLEHIAVGEAITSDGIHTDAKAIPLDNRTPRNRTRVLFAWCSLLRCYSARRAVCTTG
jgi:hypothetical protein